MYACTCTMSLLYEIKDTSSSYYTVEPQLTGTLYNEQPLYNGHMSQLQQLRPLYKGHLFLKDTAGPKVRFHCIPLLETIKVMELFTYQ